MNHIRTFSNNDLETTALLQIRPVNNLSPRRRCKALTRWVYGLFIILALFLVAVWSYGVMLSTKILSPPSGEPRKNWEGFRNQSWCVGMDLSAGYGTASIAFNNGSVFNIAQRTAEPDGGSGYNEVLARLSLQSSTHPTPPYYNRTAQWDDLGRQWKRWFNKLRGLPASDDVLALISVLQRLRTDGNVWLRRHGLDEMQAVFITVPLLPALYNEDLVDAAEFLGLQLLTLPWYINRSGDAAQWPVSEINTAMAGVRVGLKDVFPNPSEDWRPWLDNVFFVLFTEQALTAHVSPIAWAPHFYAAVGVANFSLGLAAKGGKGEEMYWEEVRGVLRGALGGYLGRGNRLGRVIVHGEATGNEVFIKILREEVESSQKEKQQLRWHWGGDSAASRGAAVFGNWCQRGLGRGDMSGCFPDLRPRPQGW
jgi:hypothetical protein